MSLLTDQGLHGPVWLWDHTWAECPEEAWDSSLLTTAPSFETGDPEGPDPNANTWLFFL